jgi:hypothetical protein
MKKVIMSNSAGNNTGGGSALGNVPPKVWLYVIGIPVVLGASYFGVIRPVMKKLGVIKSEEDKTFEKVNDLVEKQPFWSRSYYLTINNGKKPLTNTQAKFFSDELYNATRGGWTGWGTDEEKIAGAIRNIGSKAGISQVAEKFWNTRQSDLLGVLTDELDDNYFATYVTQPISTYA